MPFIFLLVVCFCLWYERLFSNVRKFWGVSSSLSGGLKTPCLWVGVGWLEATSLSGDLAKFSHCGRHLSLVSWTGQFCLVLFFQNKCFTLFLEGVNYLVLMFLLWTVNVSFSSVSFHLIPRFLDSTSALSGTWCLQSSVPQSVLSGLLYGAVGEPPAYGRDRWRGGEGTLGSEHFFIDFQNFFLPWASTSPSLCVVSGTFLGFCGAATSIAS